MVVELFADCDSLMESHLAIPKEIKMKPLSLIYCFRGSIQMIEKILFLTHGTLLLLFGAFVSRSFAGISFRKKKNIWMFLALCAFIGVLQLITLFAFGEESEWKLYPLTTHLPLAIFLCVVYKKRLETVLATFFTAYLFCQPVKWFGVLAYYIMEIRAG